MKSKWPNPARGRPGRLILLALGMASLAGGIWGGLARLPLNIPLPGNNAAWITFHGPLMVCGFLGTVIGLERAVGLTYRWTFLSPLLTGLGSAMLLAGKPGWIPRYFIVAGSAFFLLISIQIFRLQKSQHTFLMTLGAAAWLTANILWTCAVPINRLVPCYIGFLGLVILGERLDLSRFQRPVSWAQPALSINLVILLAGIGWASFQPEPGQRLMGIGLLLISAWLMRFDIAHRSIRASGLPRFMAASLLGGYVWLTVSGLLFLGFTPRQSGVYYDAALHAFFLGFVFSMIFGHAPIIFPAVLALPPVPMRNRFYIHLALLHLSLIVRLSSDVSGWGQGRQWGGVLNALTVAVFLANTVTSLIKSSRKS